MHLDTCFLKCCGMKQKRCKNIDIKTPNQANETNVIFNVILEVIETCGLTEYFKIYCTLFKKNSALGTTTFAISNIHNHVGTKCLVCIL